MMIHDGTCDAWGAAHMIESLDDIERVFLALSDKTRIRLVGLMSNGEVSVNYLCESLGESQPKVSRHLAYLRTMGVVNTRRDGKWIYYRLSGPESQLGSRFFRDTLNWIDALSRAGQGTIIRTATVTSGNNKEVAEVVDNIYEETDMKNDREDTLEIYLL